MKLKSLVASAVAVGGLTAGALGLGAATATAQPAPPPPPPAPAAPPAGPNPGQPPAWAPPQPVPPVWANGNQQVWDQGWNHWGVWVNGVFVPTF